jgi:23S rRNA (cytidine1920-2'-O)/16S rRNA (cytidine1409-2'-O)-methyltransferase
MTDRQRMGPTMQPSPPRRQRLDVALVERGLVESRARAQALVLAGEVRVDGAVVTRPGQMVGGAATVTVAAPPRSSAGAARSWSTR